MDAVNSSGHRDVSGYGKIPKGLFEEVTEVRSSCTPKVCDSKSRKPVIDLIEAVINTYKSRRSSGWRVGVSLATLSVLVSLIINVTVAAWLSRNATFTDGVAQLVVDDCDRVRNIDTWVHLATNIMSTLLLSGSNYTMQVLVGPTRQEVDRAHQKKKWLDIGIPSTRNLARVSRWRMVLWLVLGLSSIPLHLVLNSAFYSAVSAHNYNIFVVTPSFLKGSIFVTYSNKNGVNTTDHPPVNQLLHLHHDGGGFEKLSNLECIDAYAHDINTNRRNLFIVSSANNSANSSLNTAISSLLYSANYSFNMSLTDGMTYWWICPDTHPLDTCPDYINSVRQNASNWHPFGFKAQYCLSERFLPRCSFNANIPIVLTVIAANVVKLTVMACVVFFYRSNPMLVVGDAIQSFLSVPDQATRSRCLLARADVKREFGVHEIGRTADICRLRRASDRTQRWYAAASPYRWSLSLLLLLLCIFGTIGLYLGAFNALGRPSWLSLKAMGFGDVHLRTMIGGNGWLPAMLEKHSDQIIAGVLIANLPQLILSFLYLSINGLISAMYMADEWSDFVQQRKTLRVSRPHGSQRSTYFLQLPYKIALPLMLVAALLHWLLSRSLFLVVITEWSEDGDLVSLVANATCGYSLPPLLATIVLVSIVPIALITLAFRKYNPFIPLVSSSSLAIAGSCHSPPWEEDSALKPLQWGVVKPPEGRTVQEMQVIEGGIVKGHCCFSSGDVDMPVNGMVYT